MNFKYFIWHAFFLALASSFMDIDTIMPAMLQEAGGQALQIGILITIMMGGSSFSQIFFAPFLHNKLYKKRYLLLGINARVIALLGLAILFIYFDTIPSTPRIWIIMLLVSIFSLSGAFANISYTDILGKSIRSDKRKSLLSLKQTISAVGIFLSAFIARTILARYSIPLNYSILFFCAAGFLAIASYGFWRLQETKGVQGTIYSTTQFFNFIKKELTHNKQLRSYLLLINTLGTTLGLMPFLILYTRQTPQTANFFIGNLLLIKVTGGIVAGIFLFYASKTFKYAHTLYVAVFLSAAILLLAYFSSVIPWLIYLAFFLGGINAAAYLVTVGGILLEISNTSNRTIYAGLVGTGNILPALFPLLGGFIIKMSGFTPFFIMEGVLLSISFFLIHQLNCKK